MRGRRTTAIVFAALALPVLVALVEAVSFRIRFRTNFSMISGGEERHALVHVPQNRRPGTRIPLVVTLHGGKVRAALQRDLSRWNRLADRHGFAVVYPEGIGRVWRTLHRGEGLERDLRFLGDLIERLVREHDLDPTRVYVNGLSNGGGMAFALSCRFPERIAAVGLVAAAHMVPWSWCPDPSPMPVISFHGTDDRIVPYRGGETWVVPTRFPDIEGWTARWAERNRCGASPEEGLVAVDVRRREYGGCARDSPVVLYTIEGGGHTWPGGPPLPEWFMGNTTQSVDATELMWEFFEARSRRASRDAGGWRPGVDPPREDPSRTSSPRSCGFEREARDTIRSSPGRDETSMR